MDTPFSVAPKRKENWRDMEVRVLVNAYADLHTVIDGRFTPTLTHKDKTEAWEQAAQRTVDECKKELSDLKTLVKKERERRRRQMETGAGPAPAPLRDWEEQLLTCLPQVTEVGFGGLWGGSIVSKKVGLQFKANLENLTNLKPEGEDFRWYVRLKCTSCGEETTEFQYLTLCDNVPLKGGRGHASMVVKCKLCGRENSIDIMPDSMKAYNADDANKFKTIVVFDCRGVEPVDFSPRVGFTGEGEETGTQFPEIELTEGEWCDYDEKKRESVGVSEIEHKFVTVK